VGKPSLNLLLVLLALCSLAGLFSPLHWFLDLFNHFRPQALAAGIVMLAPVLYFRSKRYLWLAVTVIALNGALMGMRVYAFAKNMPDTASQYAGETLSVLSSNVLTSNSDHASVVSLVEEERPDIFIALEVNAAWVRSLEKIEDAYPYRFKLPADDNFGVAVYSKIPFDEKVLEVGRDYHLPLVQMNFRIFSLMVLHPIPPTGELDTPETRLYLTEAARLAGEAALPVIVAGDFNTTFWSDNIKPFISAGLTSANPSGIAWTWPAMPALMPLAIQIDHIFVRGADVRSFDVLRNVGSDHYPVKASFVFPARQIAP
jgi:endonuclease/exonuclease/phosphatase (EEP) superfamily protein YafD